MPYSESEHLDPRIEAIREEARQKLEEKLERFDIRPDPNHKDQHFLINPETIGELIESAEVEDGDTVLEVGAGPGSVTEELAKRVGSGRVIAVEVDPRFEPLLRELQAEYPSIELVMGDYLTVDTPEADKIVANPPFSILEPMLQRFTQERVEDVALIIGDKFAQRSLARPGSRDFTKTSLLTQAYFHPEYIRRIDRNDFYPDTSERSAILKMSALKREADPVMQLVADMLMEAPERRVSGLVSAVCNEYGMPRGEKVTANNYEEVISPSALRFAPQLMEKRLQDVDNRELSMLLQKLMSVRQQRIKRRNSRRPHFSEEE